MKMLMLIVDESKKEELEVFLNHSGVRGYTEVAHAAGMGISGLRLGSSAFPKTSALVFTILSEEALVRAPGRCRTILRHLRRRAPHDRLGRRSPALKRCLIEAAGHCAGR